MYVEQRASRSRSRGFTIVELMVGVLIAMLIGIAATSTVVLFSASQRAGMGTSVALASTTSSLAAIGEDVAHAGLGFIPNGPFKCNQLNLSGGSRAATLLQFAPIRLERGSTTTTGTDFDTIEVLYGTEVAGGADVRLAAQSNLASADLSSMLPVSINQAVLLAPSPDDTSGPCTVRTVTDIKGLTLTLDGALVSGSTAHYGPGSRVGVLGNIEWRRYRVANGDLLVEWPMQNTSAVVMRNVVAFRVQYGIADAGATRSTSISTWATLARVRAVRLSILTRSNAPQRPKPGEPCDATTSTPAPLVAGDPALNLAADWQCYSYRRTSVTVPLRNLAWGLNAKP